MLPLETVVKCTGPPIQQDLSVATVNLVDVALLLQDGDRTRPEYGVDKAGFTINYVTLPSFLSLSLFAVLLFP